MGDEHFSRDLRTVVLAFDLCLRGRTLGKGREQTRKRETARCGTTDARATPQAKAGKPILAQACFLPSLPPSLSLSFSQYCPPLLCSAHDRSHHIDTARPPSPLALSLLPPSSLRFPFPARLLLTLPDSLLARWLIIAFSHSHFPTRIVRSIRLQLDQVVK